MPSAKQLARRRGFPADRRDSSGMSAWCAQRHRCGWLEQPAGERGTVFLFEDRA